jgi:hypothetical protein
MARFGQARNSVGGSRGVRFGQAHDSVGGTRVQREYGLARSTTVQAHDSVGSPCARRRTV